uniref:Uncharacterized protein n=1 Tax=Monopterus albus TaxID=43700 RepID=A0A3Q3IH05_MONAL
MICKIKSPKLGERCILLSQSQSWQCLKCIFLCQQIEQCAAPQPELSEVSQVQEPMKFSTSKGSHSAWKVNSMGSQHAQPLRRVLSVSLLFSAFLLWCALRGETDIDAQLGKELTESEMKSTKTC